MGFEAKTSFLLGFLILITTLFVASSLFFTDEASQFFGDKSKHQPMSSSPGNGENMKKLTYLRDAEKLSEVVIRKPSNSPPLPWAKDLHERGLKGGFKKRDPQPPPPRHPWLKGPYTKRDPQPPPPRHPGNPGPSP